MLGLVHHRKGVVDLGLQPVHKTGALLHRLLPLVDERDILVGDTCRKAELVHLDGRCQLHHKAFALDLGLGRAITAFGSSRTAKPARMARSRHDLAHGRLDILRIRVVMLLGGKMDEILSAVVVRDAYPVPADGHKVLADGFQEVVDIHPELLVILFGFPALRHRAELLHGRLEGFFIG